MSDRPDPYTNLWWREQAKGMTHSINRCNAEYASAADLIEALTERVVILEQQLNDSRVEIGRLRDELEENMEKIREAWKTLKNGN